MINFGRIEREDYEDTRVFVDPNPGFVTLEGDLPNPREYGGKVFLVDGVLKRIGRGTYRGYPVLISQIAVGSAVVEVGMEPEIYTEPRSLTVIAVYGKYAKDLEKEFPNVEILPSESPDPSEGVRTKMVEMEMELAKEIATSNPGSLVLKDGTLRPIYRSKEEPIFVVKSGPFGLVKNVEDIGMLEVFFEDILAMERGERTKAFYKKVAKGKDSHLQVSTFVKLMGKGEEGIVRVDAAVKDEGEFDHVLTAFDEIAWILSELSIPYRMRRYPQNLPAVEYLEMVLRAHLADPGYVLDSIISRTPL